MYSRKQFLDFAFDEAMDIDPIAGVEDQEVAIARLTTAMRAYSDREGCNFTDEEIRSTIIAGLETIHKADKDFVVQTKIGSMSNVGVEQIKN